MTIIIISVMAIVVVTLIFLIVKTAVAPKRIEALPKLIKQGKTQKAIKLAKQLLQKDSKLYMANYYLGKAYIKEGKNELAILEYKHVNETALFGQHLNELEFRKEYAELLLKFNQPQEALKNYLLLTKLEPKNGENYYQAGYLYEQQNRYDLALGFMQKAVAVDKKHAKAHAEIGLMLYRTKQFSEAKKEIDLAIKLSPETYSSYYYLGKILKDAKDLQSAIKAFEKAQRDPDVKLKAIIEHGSCYMIAGRYDSAMVDFQRAIEYDKNNETQETLYARYFLAACYEKSRKIDKAIELWEEIYKRNKGFRDVSAKLSEYKDIQTNDNMKDYLTCSNEEFVIVCKNAAVNGLSLQVLTAEQKKWGCQLTGIVKSDDSWMNVRKQVLLIRFFREPDPLDEKMIMQTIDDMKPLNSTKSYIFSSSGFSQQAKRFAENRPVELIEKQKLEAVLAKAGSN